MGVDKLVSDAASSAIPAQGERRFYEGLKRLVDLVVASIALAVFAPFWLLIAILIKLMSPGPILYVTDVVGKDGKIFRLYKFRTMRADGGESTHAEYLARYVKGDEPYTVVRRDDGREEKIYKIVNDGRVIRMGRHLRAAGLDEFPQLLNVLKGEMSMVGPRPPRVAEYQHYDEWHRQRLSVIPGITGLYQVTARSRVPFNEMVRIDLEYIRRRSLWLDFKIMLVTPFRLILMRQGGY